METLGPIWEEGASFISAIAEKISKATGDQLNVFSIVLILDQFIIHLFHSSSTYSSAQFIITIVCQMLTETSYIFVHFMMHSKAYV